MESRNWEAVSKHFNVCQFYLIKLLKIIPKKLPFIHTVWVFVRYFGKIAKNHMTQREEMKRMEIPTLSGGLALRIDNRCPSNVNLFTLQIVHKAWHMCASYLRTGNHLSSSVLCYHPCLLFSKAKIQIGCKESTGFKIPAHCWISCQ